MWKRNLPRPFVGDPPPPKFRQFNQHALKFFHCPKDTIFCPSSPHLFKFLCSPKSPSGRVKIWIMSENLFLRPRCNTWFLKHLLIYLKKIRSSQFPLPRKFLSLKQKLATLPVVPLVQFRMAASLKYKHFSYKEVNYH